MQKNIKNYAKRVDNIKKVIYNRWYKEKEKEKNEKDFMFNTFRNDDGSLRN